MSTVEQTVEAITALPREEFWKLTDELIARRDAAWDRQLEEDAEAGRLDSLWENAEKEIAAGETTDLDEFLRHQKLPG
ncbi:MAG: hypothetical protein Fur0032_20180 [Terrimicrobiaceae bacterium]